MRYFGVPSCPYCKKRVNLIRVWSLKRQGEYQCPRCGGISNIFLSPLIHVFAVLAVFSGGAVYFFHKFVLNDISLETLWQVFLPFALFFLLSLFLVYLAKPVIKKVPRSQVNQKRRDRKNGNNRGSRKNEDMWEDQPYASAENHVYYDNDDYLPPQDYRTGPMPQELEDDVRPYTGGNTIDVEKTSVVEVSAPPVPRTPPVRKPAMRKPAPARRPSSQGTRVGPDGERRTVRRQPEPQRTETSRPRPSDLEPRRRTSSLIPEEMPKDDLFAKYDDPEYIERRLRELERERKSGE